MDKDKALRRLKAAGWSVGVAVVAPDVWIVTGTNGENQIRAEAPTENAAWREALDQARSLGMLDRLRPGDPEPG